MATATLSSNTQTPWLVANGPQWRRVRVAARGTFGGGTVTVQIGLEGTTNVVTLGELAWTAANAAQIDLAPNDQLRFSLAGATSPAVVCEVTE